MDSVLDLEAFNRKILEQVPILHLLNTRDLIKNDLTAEEVITEKVSRQIYIDCVLPRDWEQHKKRFQDEVFHVARLTASSLFGMQFFANAAGNEGENWNGVKGVVQYRSLTVMMPRLSWDSVGFAIGREGMLERPGVLLERVGFTDYETFCALFRTAPPHAHEGLRFFSAFRGHALRIADCELTYCHGCPKGTIFIWPPDMISLRYREGATPGLFSLGRQETLPNDSLAQTYICEGNWFYDRELLPQATWVQGRQ